MLHIHDLHISLGKNAILKGLSLSAEKGQIIGILGKNGAGKTTLFRTIAGDYRPSLGSLTWEGKPFTSGQAAFLETEPHFYPFLKGSEYLQLILGARNTTSLRNSISTKWADFLEIPLGELVDNYSTGMQKKLALIGVFLQNRPVLLLDEPFNGVDLASNVKIVSILNRLKEQGEKTVLISSHILSTLTETCDAIAILQEGKIDKLVKKSEFDSLHSELKSDNTTALEKLF